MRDPEMQKYDLDAMVMYQKKDELNSKLLDRQATEKDVHLNPYHLVFPQLIRDSISKKEMEIGTFLPFREKPSKFRIFKNHVHRRKIKRNVISKSFFDEKMAVSLLSTAARYQ